ncbi:MAG: IS5/IS1182 family transposase, partial [Cyanobacteria bacterium J06638_20]
MSYRIRNWSEYNAGLKQRGSVTFWLSDDVMDGW